MLAAVFNRKPAMIGGSFREILRGYPFNALQKAFSKAESTLRDSRRLR